MNILSALSPADMAALAVFLVLWLQNLGFRWVEALIITLLGVIAVCFGLQIAMADPDWAAVIAGFAPTTDVVTNPDMLYLALGIIGATVMPHNLYLHSSIVQTRKYEQTGTGKREAIHFATIDTVVALMMALFINAGILVVAAATFHQHGKTDVAEIQDAYHLLAPMLGVTGASVIFAVALLASGQNATLTGTLAGQIVMEGFLNLRMRPWLRRLITRMIAIVPAAIVAGLYGESGTAKLLVFSQVILSLQLPFAVIPLVIFTSDRRKMGEFASPRWMGFLAWATALLIVALNAKMLFDFIAGA